MATRGNHYSSSIQTRLNVLECVTKNLNHIDYSKNTRKEEKGKTTRKEEMELIKMSRNFL